MMTLPEVERVFAQHGEVPIGDVVCENFSFPLRARFYPLGFPLELETNSAQIVDAVWGSWGTFKQLYDTPPIVLRVGVFEGKECKELPTPECRVQQGLFSFISDAHHYGITDMNALTSSVWLTEASLRHHDFVRYNFLECAAIVPIATRFVTGVHSGCVARNGTGVLLCGDSGAGKSTLSYACAKAGWTYITDDGSYLVHDCKDLTAVGNCHQVRFRPAASTFFPEVDGKVIVHRSTSSKPSIELVPAEHHSIQIAQSATISHLVMLNRREGSNDGFRAYDKNIVRDYLRQGRFTPPAFRSSHYQMIDRLLEKEVLELRYRDLSWAIEQLNSLVRA